MTRSKLFFSVIAIVLISAGGVFLYLRLTDPIFSDSTPQYKTYGAKFTIKMDSPPDEGATIVQGMMKLREYLASVEKSDANLYKTYMIYKFIDKAKKEIQMEGGFIVDANIPPHDIYFPSSLPATESLSQIITGTKGSDISKGYFAVSQRMRDTHKIENGPAFVIFDLTKNLDSTIVVKKIQIYFPYMK